VRPVLTALIALATLSPAEQATWRAAVTAYANGWSRKDAVFDSDLVALTHALVRAGDARRTLPALAGPPGLPGLDATIFHESMHQWDGQVAATLTASAERQHKTVPDLLSHAMIFYTAGAAVQSVAPDYTPYADANGIWQRGPGPFKAPLDAAWKPYLDGRGTLDAAIDAVIRRLPAAPLQ
jgi:hypothetical protein